MLTGGRRGRCIDNYILLQIRRPPSGGIRLCSMSLQLSISMFSAIVPVRGLGSLFYQHPSFVWLLLGCRPSVVSNQFVSGPGTALLPYCQEPGTKSNMGQLCWTQSNRRRRYLSYAKINKPCELLPASIMLTLSRSGNRDWLLGAPRGLHNHENYLLSFSWDSSRDSNRDSNTCFQYLIPIPGSNT